MSKINAQDSEQLTDSMYYILLSLLQPRHGYAIMKFLEELTQGEVQMGPGTLYTLLKKMCKLNWIMQMTSDDPRTKNYCITKQGNQLLQHELKRRERMVQQGQMVVKELDDGES